MRSSMNVLVLAGAILVILGLIGLAIPVITTQHTTDVAKIGDLKVQATERSSYAIPPVVSGGALVLGVVLIGACFYQRR